MCSLKMSSHTNRKKTTLLGKTHEISFRDGEPSEPIVDMKVEPKTIKRSIISKSFDLDFIAYVIETESQIFEKAMCHALLPKIRCIYRRTIPHVYTLSLK